MDDRFTDEELRTLLRQVLPEVDEARIEAALEARRVTITSLASRADSALGCTPGTD